MRTKTIIVYLLLCTGFFFMSVKSSFAQLAKLWENNYPYIQDSANIYFGNLQGNRLQFDASNNPYYFSEFAPAGNDPSSFTYNAQMQTAKYNPTGTVVWTHRDTSIYQNNCNQCGLSFFRGLVSSDGTSFGIGASSGYSVLTCTQANGQPKWRNTFSTYGVADVVQDNAGNTIITSCSYPVEPQYRSQYIILMKVNKAGNTNWTTQYSAPDSVGWLQSQKCVTDAVGKLYVAASTYFYVDSGRTKGNLFLTKFDTSGNKLWDKKIDSLRGWQLGDAIFNATDSSIYISVCSNTLIPSDSTIRVKLIKVSNQGEVVWTKMQPAPWFLSMRLKRDNSGNIYWWHKNGQYGNVYGMNYVPEGEIDKYNPAGQMIGPMYGSSFDVDASGYTYAAHSYQKNDSGYYTISKYSANGSLLYDSPVFSYSSWALPTGFYDEVVRDKQSGVYLLKNSSVSPMDHSTISITKYNAACTATAAPAKPKSITGPATLYCDLSTSAYSCPVVAKATNYYWTVPDGMMIDSGQGTTKIYIHRYSFAAFNAGLVSVYAANCYGASAVLSKTITDSLKAPAKITGSTSVCKGQMNVEYTAAAVTDAQRYQWILPAGASFSQGFSGTEQTVHIDFGSSGGKVSVYAVNWCDSSVVKSVQVKVTNCVAGGLTVEAISNKSVVYPNPSAGAFTLRLSDGYRAAVSVVVKDVSGKVVEQLSSVIGSSVSFGGKLVKGVYFVEVMSGGEREVLKVVKE